MELLTWHQIQKNKDAGITNAKVGSVGGQLFNDDDFSDDENIYSSI